LDSGTDGYQGASAENETLDYRPLLVVLYDTTPRPPTITSMPANVLTNEGPGVAFVLTVGVSGTLPSFQWYKVVGGVTNLLAGENSATIVRNPAVPADSGDYFLNVSNESGTTNSPLISVTINADVIPPALLGAASGGTFTTVRLTFSEPVAQAGAETPGNYTIANLCGGPNVPVSLATRVNPTTVDLTATLTFGTSYKVTVGSGVTDLAATPNPINPAANSALVLQSAVLLDWNHAWKFTTNNLDLEAWTLASYDDLSWSNGVGMLGWETSAGPVGGLPAPLDINNTNFLSDAIVRNNTICFRGVVNNPFPSVPLGVQIAARHYVDDAIIFYLNGAESFRYNLTNAPEPIVFATRGLAAGEASLQTNTVPSSQVIAGDNVIAVGLHASGANSSDCLFGIQLVATYPHAVLSVQALPNGDVQLRWPCGYKLVTTDTLQTPPTANNWTEVGDTDGERTVTPAANQKRFYGLIP